MTEFKKQFVMFKEYAERILENIPESKNNSSDSKDAITRNITKNQLDEMNKILYGLVANENLINDLINPSIAKNGNSISNIKFNFKEVASNSAQRDAVKKLLNMDNLLVIQGPPGTGKTTVITEMIMQILNKNKNSKIMITSSAHEAVNNVIDKLLNNKIGNLARIKNEKNCKEIYKKLDCDYILESYLDNLKKESYIIHSKLSETLLENQYKIMNSIIMTKSVIGVTINAIHSCKFSNTDQFDYVFVDEVGKSPLIELMSVLPHAKKLILIGDPLQLPPGLTDYSKLDGFSKKDYDYLLMNPYINYLFDHINQQCKVLLDTQFRMVQPIGTYISLTYYNGQLKNGIKKYPEDALNLITYDVKVKVNDSKNLVNDTEITILKTQLRKLEKEDKDIAIITFYKDQVKKLIKELNLKDDSKIKIGSVDAFQGKDADIVFLLCVRNCDKPTSFISKPNRLNVAISRAKEQMWVIGNLEYLTQVDYFRRYVNFRKNYGDKTIKCNIYKYNYKNGMIENLINEKR